MKKKLIKPIIIVVLVLIVLLFLILIYNNLFAESNSTRYDGIEKYELTNNEINAVKDKINEINEVSDIDIYINSKIIKIIVSLEQDVDFEKIKTISNESLIGFKEDNLSYYDVQIFIKSSNEESEIYPQIGYKFKADQEFSW